MKIELEIELEKSREVTNAAWNTQKVLADRQQSASQRDVLQTAPLLDKVSQLSCMFWVAIERGCQVQASYGLFGFQEVAQFCIVRCACRCALWKDSAAL